MKSFFSKLGGLLLCGVMFIAVGCHDYAEDIQQTNDRIDAIDKVLNGSSDGVAKDLAALKAELAALKADVAANTALTASIEGILADLAEVETNLGNLKTALDGKADASKVNELQKSLEGEIAALEESMSAVQANLETLNGLEAKFTKVFGDAVADFNKQINELKGQISELSGDVENLETNLGVVSGQVQTLEGKVATLSTDLTDLNEKVQKNTEDIKTLQDELDEEIESIQTALAAKADTAAVNNAIAELDAAIEEKASAEALNEAVLNLENQISKLDEDFTKEIEEAIAKAKTEFAEDIKVLNEAIAEEFKKFEEKVTALAGRVVVTEAQIAQLFNRIQSVVFRPEFSDNAEHVVYATAGENAQTLLEGYNYITYKVYPAACAETIANAINSKEEKLLDVTFDAINVKSAGLEVLDVVSAKADEDGCLTICYKPTLGKEFYTDAAKYSAALVLKETLAENPQNFSTEYTHFIPEDNPKNWTMKPYVGDAEYAATAEYANVEFPFVAFDKEKYTEEILAGVAPRFVCGTEVLTAEEFAALGYNAEYTLVTTAAYPTEEPEQAIAVSIDGTSSVALACLAKLGVDNIGESATVTKTLTWNLTEESVKANAKLTVIDLPYNLVAEAASRAHYIPYTDKETAVSAEMSNVNVYFVSQTDPKVVLTPAEMEELYPVVQVTSSAACSKDIDLFVITGESYPVSVKLAEDVVAEDVTKKVRVRYSFDAPVLGRTPLTTSFADVIIDPQTYHFYTLPVEYYWSYDEHATVDASIFINNPAQYVFKEEVKFDTKKSPVVQDDVKLSEMLGSLEYTVTVDGTKVDPATYDILLGANLDIAPADMKSAKMTFKGIEWGKVYSVLGRGAILTDKLDAEGNPIPGAIVYVHFDLTTVDRNREPAVLTASPIDVLYALNTTGVVNTKPISFAAINNILVDSLHIMNDGRRVPPREYLANAIPVSDVVKWGETSVDNKGAEWSLVPDFAAATYDVNYTADNDFIHVDNVVAKKFTYEMTFNTWYGQEITLVQPINLVDPKYDFSAVYQYVDKDTAKNCFYTEVLPEYTFTSGALTDFSVREVELNSVFDVVNAKGERINDTMAALGLKRTFALINNTDNGIVFDAATNKISYLGKADQVNVNGYLYIETTAGTKYEIDETIFTGDYKSFEVRKFDPLRDLTIKNADQTVVISENREYEINVLDNYSLLDKVDIKLENVNQPNELIGDSTMMGIYDATVTYKFEMVQPTELPTGIEIDYTNGKITIDNSKQVNFLKPVIIKVTPTVTYPQNVKVGEPTVYTFKSL